MTTNHSNPTNRKPNDGQFATDADQMPLDSTGLCAILRRGTVGTLALTHDAQPAIYSGLYVFDEVRHTVYFHASAIGSISHRPQEKVCFGVSLDDAGVVIYGRGDSVLDETESKRAFELLVAKYLNHTHLTKALTNTPIYRIQIDRWSGKQKLRLHGLPMAASPEERRN